MAKHQFRRGQRVVVRREERDYSTQPATVTEVWRYGTVTNPSVGYNRWATTEDYVRVRFDSQQGYETGQEVPKIDTRAAPDDKTEFELRHYDLRYLSHDKVAALRLALEHVNHRDDVLTDDMVVGLLAELPALP